MDTTPLAPLSPEEARETLEEILKKTSGYRHLEKIPDPETTVAMTEPPQRQWRWGRIALMMAIVVFPTCLVGLISIGGGDATSAAPQTADAETPSQALQEGPATYTTLECKHPVTAEMWSWCREHSPPPP